MRTLFVWVRFSYWDRLLLLVFLVNGSVSELSAQSASMVLGYEVPVHDDRGGSTYENVSGRRVGVLVSTGGNGTDFGIGFDRCFRSYVYRVNHPYPYLLSEQADYVTNRITLQGTFRIIGKRSDQFHMVIGVQGNWIPRIVVVKQFSGGRELVMDDPENKVRWSTGVFLGLRYVRLLGSRYFALVETEGGVGGNGFSDEPSRLSLDLRANPPSSVFNGCIKLGFGVSLPGSRSGTGTP